MTDSWSPTNTSTHQDHVIAHVIGATVIGYFVLDEAFHILLDIGFIWTIYVDGSMALLPHPVALGELETTEAAREEIKADVDLFLNEHVSADLKRLTAAPVQCLIHEVSFFSDDDRRRLILEGEEASLAIETSMGTAEIRIYPL
jgi:hypothetical protein